MRRLLGLAAAAFVLALAPASAVVLATDPAGDVAVSGGLPAGLPPPAPTPLPSPLPSGTRPDWSGADILSLNATTGNRTTLAIAFAAPPGPEVAITVNFTLAPGDRVLPRDGYAPLGNHSVTVSQGARTGLPVEAAVAGNELRLTFGPEAALQQGDVLSAIAVQTVRPDGGLTPAADDDTTGRDRAPDTGGARYATPRAPDPARLRLTIVGGESSEGPFTGKAATGAPGSEITVHVRAENLGETAGTFRVSVVNATSPGPAAQGEASPAATSQPTTLQGGASQTVPITFRLPEGGGRSVAFTVQADGAHDELHVSLLADPVPPALHKAEPASLAFLTPMAEGLGLVRLLGNQAELFLFGVLVLLAILAVYLAMTLRRGPGVPAIDGKPVLRPGKVGAASRSLGLGDGVELEVTGALRAADWELSGEAAPGESPPRGRSDGADRPARIWPPLDEEATPAASASSGRRAGGVGADGTDGRVADAGSPRMASPMTGDTTPRTLPAGSSSAAPSQAAGDAAPGRGEATDVSSRVDAALGLPSRAPQQRARADSGAGAARTPQGAAAATPAGTATHAGPTASTAAAGAALAPRALAAGATGAPVRIAHVSHDPPAPKAGQPVTTTATLQNDSGAPLRVRVLLQVDGRELAGETLDAPAASTTSVVLRWTAKPGRNHVKVKAVPA